MSEVVTGVDAPAVMPVAAPEATPAPETTADQVALDTPAPTPEPEKMLPQSEVNKIVAKEKAKESKRMERVLRESIRAEVERDHLRKQLEERDKPAQPQGKPQSKDFASPEEYVEALTDWRLEHKLSERSKQSEAQRTEHEEREAARQQYEYIQGRFEEAEEKFPGLYDRLRADELPMTPRMTEFVIEDEHGFTVGDYLANHVDEAKKIARLSPYKQLVELRNIASKLTAPPKPTKTPAPIVPNSGSAQIPKGYEGLSTSEHVDKWLKRKQR